MNKCCIIENVFNEGNNVTINDFMKVFYNYKYIEKYSKKIDANKTYSTSDANKILKANPTWGFTLETKANNILGKDMIESVAFLEERAEINFESVNWDSFNDYIKELNHQGYKTEKISEAEFLRINNVKVEEE